MAAATANGSLVNKFADEIKHPPHKSMSSQLLSPPKSEEGSLRKNLSSRFEVHAVDGGAKDECSFDTTVSRCV